MITFNNIVTAFQNFTTNHFFLKTFSFGNSEDMDLPKYNEYPLLHLNYTGADYDEGTKTYNFEIFVLDLPSDKLDKVSYQREVISDAEQCVEDLLADVLNGGNVFHFADQYEVTSASVTPLEEETKNVLAGVLLTLAIEVPYQYDSCDAPLEGVTPTPPGDCPVAVVQNTDQTYQVNVNSGGNLVLPDITITDVNGKTRDTPAQTDVTCQWQPLDVLNSEDTLVTTIPSYPSGAEVVLNDITLDEVDGSSVVKPSGIDLECTWFDIVIEDESQNELGTITSYPPSGTFEVSVPSVIRYPQVIYHRKPSYTTGNTGDYPTLMAAGYFDLYKPTGGVQMIQLGANNYTLAENNRFGNTSRYTATDGTPSDVGTARFSSYGSGVANVVRDNLMGVMWYNLPLSGSGITWDNAQNYVDTANASNLGGYNDWIRPTRDICTLSAMPDNNVDFHDSPNLIEDVGTRRYMTCEKFQSANLGFIIFHSNGGETGQSTSSTVGGQNQVIICRLMTLTELFG